MERIYVVPAESRPGEPATMNIVLSGEEVDGLVDKYFKDKPERLDWVREIVQEATGYSMEFKIDRKAKVTRRDVLYDVTKIHYDNIEQYE